MDCQCPTLEHLIPWKSYRITTIEHLVRSVKISDMSFISKIFSIDRDTQRDTKFLEIEKNTRDQIRSLDSRYPLNNTDNVLKDASGNDSDE